MDLTRYVDDLQDRLLTAADAAGGDARDLAQRLTAPLDAAVRLVLLEALSAAAGEITADLAPGSVDVRLRGGEPEFVVDARSDAGSYAAAPAPAAPAPAAAAGPAPATVETDEGATTRTTLRLPDHLKAQVEVAAAREGLSVNSWLVRAVAAALEPVDRPALQARPEQRGTRLTGWVR
jgi:hypothetical protein